MVKIKNIEALYKRHSNQKVETPPPAVWDRIEGSLKAVQPGDVPFGFGVRPVLQLFLLV
ncbi:hypothetical protein [Geofilum rubicundum]|uniref:Uncharacterized protein n=1 Tax=Geofilum rubicundum JCM 15548 TaxID=1236989 RepID=A0A0E9M326_9BACT|nr:hypothetical protein [Geofilum rubicundum]GAO31570.1 hypothetical protein JCM15548_13943 [Geofilum rubicundum JCM 15548]